MNIEEKAEDIFIKELIKRGYTVGQIKYMRDNMDIFKAAVASVEFVLKPLAEANDILRSTWQIAAREGKDTGWEYFKPAVEKQLNNHKEIDVHALAVSYGPFSKDEKDAK